MAYWLGQGRKEGRARRASFLQAARLPACLPAWPGQAGERLPAGEQDRRDTH